MIWYMVITQLRGEVDLRHSSPLHSLPLYCVSALFASADVS